MDVERQYHCRDVSSEQVDLVYNTGSLGIKSTNSRMLRKSLLPLRISISLQSFYTEWITRYIYRITVIIILFLLEL